MSAALCLLCLATPENFAHSTFQQFGPPSCFPLTPGDCHNTCIWRDSLPLLSSLRLLTLFRGAQGRRALAAPLPPPLRLHSPRHPHLHHPDPALLELHVHRRVGNRTRGLTGIQVGIQNPQRLTFSRPHQRRALTAGLRQSCNRMTEA